MGNTLYEIGCMLMGVIVILIGIFIPGRTLLPKRKNIKERDPESYIKSCRKALIFLGIYYILIGAVLIVIAKDPMLYLIYNILMPFLPFLPLVVMIKKYT